MAQALVIDDDRVTRNMVKTLFQKVQFDVEECEDGVDGIQSLKKKKYDVITLDLHMPRLGGEQVMQIIHKRNEDIPVIVISGYLTKEKIQTLTALGVKSFISKPFDMKHFYHEVNKLCPLTSKEN